MVERVRRRGTIASEPDRSIIDRARLGDLDAFEEIVRARMDATYRLTYAILGDEADARDATQEAFVGAWRQLSALRDADRFDAWLQRIAVNAARMAHRARRRRGVREIPSSRVAGAAELPATASPAEIDGRRLAVALRHLDVDQRTILALHHLEGRSVVELAEVLAIPEGTVKSRLHSARQALHAALAAEEREP